MMHGHEKSDLAIVAEKPANKAEQPTAEASTGASAAEPVERRAGTKGKCGPAKHVPGAEPDKRVTGAGTHTAICRHTPEVGAVCGKAARTVLCGGRAMKRTSLPLHIPRRNCVTLLGTAIAPFFCGSAAAQEGHFGVRHDRWHQ